MYYIYVYLDPRKPGNYVYGDYSFDYEPFYVGKGTGKRKLVHLYESSQKRGDVHPKIAKIRKLKGLNLDPIIIEISELNNEIDAYALEQKIISIIGSDYIEGIDDGPLTNLLLDASTPPNHKGKTYLEIYGTPELAEEQRKKRHEKQIAVGGFFRGYKHSEETKRKFSERLLGNTHRLGIKHTDKDKNKMTYSHLFAYHPSMLLYTIKSPNDDFFKTIKLGRFCKYFGISKSTLLIAETKLRIPNRGKTKGWQIVNKISLSETDNFTYSQIIYKKERDR